jgi:hypothetical protein
MPIQLVPTDSPAPGAISDARLTAGASRGAAQRARTTARSRRVVTFIGAEGTVGAAALSISQGLGLTARAAIAAAQASKDLP